MNRPLLCAALIALLPLTAFPSAPAAAQERPRGGRPPGGAPGDMPMPGRPRADPGRVVATDIAFARAARDDGQWTAFREYAAPGAQMHDDNGPIDAAGFLENRADPRQPIRWAPTEVWSSCDGTIAVSFGRSVRPDGIVGSYVTVWQRGGGERGGGERGRGSEYRWIYDTGTPDDPQPPPPPPAVVLDGDTIVVGAPDPIQARTADCGPVEGLPQDGLPARSTAAQTGGGEARDGTLRWRWEHHAPGEWRVVVDWVREGAWAEALAFDVPER